MFKEYKLTIFSLLVFAVMITFGLKGAAKQRIMSHRACHSVMLNIEDASLVPSLKQILGAIKGVTIGKLVTKDTAIEAEKKFIADTIILGYQQAKEGKFAGENLSNIDDIIRNL